MDRTTAASNLILGLLGIAMLLISMECLNQATELNQFIATGILMLIGLGSTVFSVLQFSYKAD